MKKFLVIMVLLFLIAMGCSRGPEEPGIIEIRETMFIAQMTDIILNSQSYLGRIIQIEGFFRHTLWGEDILFFVARYVPDCCGDSGLIGFEVTWEENFLGANDLATIDQYPEDNAWVRAVGELRRYHYQGTPLLYLALSDLTVLDERGEEMVHR